MDDNDDENEEEEEEEYFICAYVQSYTCHGTHVEVRSSFWELALLFWSGLMASVLTHLAA